MRLLLALGLVLSLEARAQLGLQQSSPELNWLAKENAHVKLIYSEELSSESDYLLNLVEHYSHLVGLTYGIREPQQFPLIMRPEVADPNGFVTLAPRRSEWFANATFLPFVGSSEWYQTLAIHEYRHIIQYDHFKQGAAKYLDYFLGDMGLQAALFLGLQSWYFEGDAVWAETKYTDAGRGRSPRFLARLKALVLSNHIPSYDEFLSGSYNNLYPNHYVWGYVLVSRATQKFGDDFWKRVTAHVARFPHPWRLVNSFKHVSGQSFKEFYFETMQDLRNQWKDDLATDVITEYREETFPTKVNGQLYFLKYDLDHYYQLTRRDETRDTLIAEIPFMNEVTMLGLGGSLAVYPQFLPDKRYGYKGFSDLVTVDLITGKKTQITDGERLYNPRVNAQGTKILAVEFTNEQHWQLVEFSPAGERLRSVKLKDKKIVEATYLDENRVWAQILDPTGARSLVILNLSTQETYELLTGTRNLIYNLSGSSTHLTFEAQYKGKNEIFRLSDSGALQKCTHSRIGAFAPSTDGTTLFYSDMDVNGSRLASVALTTCASFPRIELLAFNYLSKDSPSDNYNQFAPVELKNHSELFAPKENVATQSYGHLDQRLFTPHSWSFIGGRGLQLAASTANYLSTIAFDASLGRDAEETGQFYSFGVSLHKYYPLFRLSATPMQRFTTEYSSEDTLDWYEYEAGLTMTLPYLKKIDLYNIVSGLTLGAATLQTDEYQFNGREVDARSQHFQKTSVQFDFSVSKDQVFRSIVAPSEFQYQVEASRAENASNETLSSFRVYQAVNLQFPGVFKHNAVKLNLTDEQQRESNGAYRFLPLASNPLGYVFSRGYAYKFAPHYRRASANYVFPVAYPDFNVDTLWFLKRIYANAFFDSTTVDTLVHTPTLNSTGLELNFESRLLRIIPVTVGIRGVQTLQENETVYEAFFGLGSTL